VADEGSGYFLGRQAMVAAVRMADGRMPASALMGTVFNWLGISKVSEILKRLYEDGVTRSEIAAIAPEIVKLAEEGDAAGIEILDRGADKLAEMVAANHRQLPTSKQPEVVITGGLGTAPSIYRNKLKTAIQHWLPQVQINEPAMSPTAGAVMLAIEQAEGKPDHNTVETIRTTSR
jgi:glucosamine kinase